MLPGQPQELLIQQLIKIIETGSLDLDNEKVVTRLLRLRELLMSLSLAIEKVA